MAVEDAVLLVYLELLLCRVCDVGILRGEDVHVASQRQRFRKHKITMNYRTIRFRALVISSVLLPIPPVPVAFEVSGLQGINCNITVLLSYYHTSPQGAKNVAQLLFENW